MKTYQIEITNADKTPVKRFYGEMPKKTGVEIFNEFRDLYDSSHELKLSNKRTGDVIRKGKGRKSGSTQCK